MKYAVEGNVPHDWKQSLNTNLFGNIFDALQTLLLFLQVKQIKVHI